MKHNVNLRRLIVSRVLRLNRVSMRTKNAIEYFKLIFRISDNSDDTMIRCYRLHRYFVYV